MGKRTVMQANACLAIELQAGRVFARRYITTAMPWIKGGKTHLIHGWFGPGGQICSSAVGNLLDDYPRFLKG